MERVGLSPQIGVGGVDYIDHVLSPVVALRRDLNRLVVPFAERSSAQDAQVDRPAVRHIADGVDDLAHADLLEFLPVEQHLLAAGVDVHHWRVGGLYHSPAGAL